MGSVLSHTTSISTPRSDEVDVIPLPTLLREDEVNWNSVRQTLLSCPEQACLYAHGIEKSMLLRAVERNAPIDVVETLIDSDEDAIDLVSAKGRTLLHAGCNNSSIVSAILKRRPLQAKMQDSEGRLPLHLCFDENAAKLLVDSYPIGLSHRSGALGSIPLHYAVLKQSEHVNWKLVQVLFHAGKHILRAGGTHIRNKKGQTPHQLLVQALTNQMEENLWNLLVEWTGLSTMPRTSPDGPLVLHALIENGCCNTDSMMRMALDRFGEQAWERDGQGRTPLHVAAACGLCDDAALKALILANPKAHRMTDNEGRLPIDVAAESPNTQLQSLALLMKGEPRALNTRDLRNGYYPFQTSAISSQQNATNTYVLLRARPEVLSYYHTP